MNTMETTNQQPTTTPAGENNTNTTNDAANANGAPRAAAGATENTQQTSSAGATGYAGQYGQNWKKSQNSQNGQYGGQTPPQQPYTPQPPQKIRRVGTLAFALVLIASGVLLILRIVAPALDLTAVLRFSPVILIVLGLEVLVYAVRPDVKLKYDFASMFICFILVCGIGCAAVAGEFLRYYTPDNLERRATMESTLNAQAADVIAAIPGMRDKVRDATVYVDYSYDNVIAHTEGVNASELYVTMQRGVYTDAAAYAADCRAIMDGCKSAGLDFGGYRFDTWYGGEDTEMLTYELTAESPWVIGSDEAGLAAQVVSTYWYKGEAFNNEAERTEYREAREQEMLPALPATSEFAETAETATKS